MGYTMLPLTRPEMPARPDVPLKDKIADAGWGQTVEYKDYDVGLCRDGKYYVNWEYGCYGMKKQHMWFGTIEELEAFLRKRGVDPSLFDVQWHRDVFNGL